MIPRPVTPKDIERWNGRAHTFYAPASMPACEDVGVVFDQSGGGVIRIPWVLEAEELEALAAGGTVWLSIWGKGMPPVDIRVATDDATPTDNGNTA